MRPKWVTEWLEALRSGKYKKGKLLLRNHNDEYCCLGVLCELQGFVPKSVYEAKLYSFGEENECSQLPQELAVKLGLQESGFHCSCGHPLTLVNDTSDTFDKVISEIELRYPE